MTKTVVIEEVQTIATSDESGDVALVVVQPQPNTVTISLPETSLIEVHSGTPIIDMIVDQSSVIEVERIIENTVVVEQPVPTIVEVVSQGPQGVPGDLPGGGNAISILGIPVRMIDGEPDDLLSYTGSEWLNKPQEKVTDGGNF